MPDSLVLATALIQPDISALITGDLKLARAAESELEVQLLAGRRATILTASPLGV